MKKYLLGGLAAVCCAVGLSSYTGKTFTGTYLFKTNDGINKMTGTLQTYTNAQVTRITAIPDGGCYEGDYDCIVTFNTNALTQTNFSNLVTPAQQRSTVSSRHYH